MTGQRVDGVWRDGGSSARRGAERQGGSASAHAGRRRARKSFRSGGDAARGAARSLGGGSGGERGTRRRLVAAARVRYDQGNVLLE